MDVRLILGDALEVLPTLGVGNVDSVITDPPYSSGGLFRGDRARPAEDKYVCGHEVNNFHADFGGDSRDQRAWRKWCLIWLRQCRRVARKGAPLCVFTDWRQLPTLTDVIQIAGWLWRGVVVWDKTEGARPNMGRFKQQAEFIVWGSKGPMAGGEGVGCLNGVFRFAPFQGKQHIAGKPLGLMRELVKICPPGGTVLDPFMGSATTGLAALQAGRGFVGIDDDPHWYATASRRTEEARSEGPLFTRQGALFDGEG